MLFGVYHTGSLGVFFPILREIYGYGCEVGARGDLGLSVLYTTL